MIVIDLDCKPVEVNDLPMALKQADDFRHYRMDQPRDYHL